MRALCPPPQAQQPQVCQAAIPTGRGSWGRMPRPSCGCQSTPELSGGVAGQMDPAERKPDPYPQMPPRLTSLVSSESDFCAVRTEWSQGLRYLQDKGLEDFRGTDPIISSFCRCRLGADTHTEEQCLPQCQQACQHFSDGMFWNSPAIFRNLISRVGGRRLLTGVQRPGPREALETPLTGLAPGYRKAGLSPQSPS